MMKFSALAAAIVASATIAQGQTSRVPPSCSEAAGKKLPTADDVVKLHVEGLARGNPFMSYDLSANDRYLAVQIKRPLTEIHTHATMGYYWLHSDLGVYDVNTGKQTAFLDGARQGDSWATPTWSPSGRYIALTHIGAKTLDRQLYLWDVGKSSPKQLVQGALAASLRFAVGAPNSRASAYAWIDSVTVIAAMIPAGSGTLDEDDPMTSWPAAWQAAGAQARSSASIMDAHLPSSIAPAHATLGAPLTLWRINVRTGARSVITTTPSVRGRYPRDILLSQDMQWLAFTPDVRPIDASAGPMPLLNRAETELFLINLHDGRIFHPLPGRHVTLTRWSADGSTVGVRLPGDTVVQVRRDGSVFRSNPPVIAAATRARDSVPTPAPLPGRVAKPAPVHPRIEMVIDGNGERLVVHSGKTARTLISLDQDIAKLAVCRPWYVRYATQKGDTVYARVTIPPGYTSGKRYPVIVQMYPGTVHTEHDSRDDTVSYVRRSTSWEPVLLAAHGYVVLEPSIPLAGGGADHASEFSGDILPAIDSLIAFGVADPDRLGIDGVSFGGYGTAMVIEQTHRFRAASTRNGLYNLISMYGQFGPPRRLADDAGEQLWAPGWAEGGQGHLEAPPYGHWEMFQHASPLNNVDSIATPVLIVAGDMDYAAPMAQSEEFFTALNRLGKPVRFIRYAGEAHGNASAVNLRHLVNQMELWFDGWLKAPATPR
jgi:dienelactone hydrolase